MSSSRSLLTSICILLDWDFSTLSYWNAITDWEGWMKTSLLMYLAKIFAGLQIFSWQKCLFFFFSLYLYFLMFSETSLDFGPEDIFIAFTGICFPLMIINCMSSLSFDADPFLSIKVSSSLPSSSARLCSHSLWCLPAKETLLHNWRRGRLLGLSFSFSRWSLVDPWCRASGHC